MAVSDYVLSDQTASDLRLEINDALQAIVSNNANSSTPPNTFAHMWWYDTTNHILKMRNATDDDWFDIAYFNQGVSPPEITLLTKNIGADLLSTIISEVYDSNNATTDNLTEGSTNQYHTAARVRSAISAGGDVTYDSSTGVISVTSYSSSDFNSDLASKNTSDLTEGSNLYHTNERVDDRVNALISGGTGIDTTYNDTAGTLTISHANTSNASSVANVVVQGVTLDGEGHVTNLDTQSITNFANNLMPAGSIIMWHGSEVNIPSGWALCDGSSGTPDLRNRFVVGAGDSYAVNSTGGSASVTLTDAQMPNHTHDGSGLSAGPGGGHSHTAGTLKTDQAGQHKHQIYANDRGNYGSQLDGVGAFSDDAERLLEDWADTIRPAGAHTHTITGQTGHVGDHQHNFSGTTGSAGGGNGHENRPPYYAIFYIMKI